MYITMVREGSRDGEFLIYSLIYSNKLAYLQLIAISVYGNSPPKSYKKGYLKQTFSKNLEKFE